MPLAAAEQRVAKWLADRRPAMLSLLADLVNLDSGTAYHRHPEVPAHHNDVPGNMH